MSSRKLVPKQAGTVAVLCSNDIISKCKICHHHSLVLKQKLFLQIINLHFNSPPSQKKRMIQNKAHRG